MLYPFYPLLGRKVPAGRHWFRLVHHWVPSSRPLALRIYTVMYISVTQCIFEEGVDQKKSLAEYCPPKYLIYGVSEINLAFIMWVCAKLLQSCPSLYNPMDCSPPGSSVQEILPGKNTGVGCHFLLQGISWPRNRTHMPASPALAGGFFTTAPPGKLSLNVILYFVDLRLVVISWASLMAQQYRICLQMQEMQETQVWSLGW